MFGSSIVCVNTGGKLSTVPRVLASGAAMTNWTRPPAAGDSLAVYNDQGTLLVADDVWSLSQITNVTLVTTNVANGCPVATGLTQAGDISAANPSYQFTFVSAAPAVIPVGAAMRFFRRVRYRIYKDTDNQWYLGFFDCVTGRVPVCTSTQPIAGPFQPYSATGTSGLQFAYYDSTGAVTATRTLVARISLVVRGQGATLLNLAGAGATVFRDSLRMEVGLRNRK